MLLKSIPAPPVVKVMSLSLRVTAPFISIVAALPAEFVPVEVIELESAIVAPVRVTSPISVARTAAPVLDKVTVPPAAFKVISSAVFPPPPLSVPAMVGAIVIFPPLVVIVRSVASLRTICPAAPSWNSTAVLVVVKVTSAPAVMLISFASYVCAPVDV